MKDQDKRAVEGLARCGMSLDSLCESFPKFPKEEIEEIYRQISSVTGNESFEQDIKCCGMDAR
ncbi:MAG: hypothetical protein K5877_09585 [Lachnospiraceae bacterium]|nr:hypothetical protein [Lachnospiraceae bacterium]